MAEDPDRHWKALLRNWRPNVPIILAAEGTAIAGGTELLGATEIRVAGESAKFGISEVKWSLYPMGGSAVRIRARSPTRWPASCCSPTSTSPRGEALGSDSSATSCPTARRWTRPRRSAT